MKKYFIALFMFLFVIFNNETVMAQYIGFEPNEGAVYTCYGTNSQVSVPIYWTWELTPYPPKVSIAAYAIFTADGQTYENNVANNEERGSNIPASLLVSSGTHTWTMELHELFLGAQNYEITYSVTHTFYVNYKLYAANNFGGGTINLEGATVSGSGSSSAYKIVGESMAVGAIDQNDGAGYYRIWNTNGTNNSVWDRNSTHINGATSRNYSYTVASGDNGITLKANLRRVCDLEFQANTGMYVNGSSRTSPWTESVVEQNSINAYAYGYSSNGLDYSFSYWDNNPNSNNITASAHTTYTAVYIGKPSNTGKNFAFNGDIGDPINITWTDNQNSSVTEYQIWRRVKHNGILGDATLLATVSRGVQTYTDNEYSFTNGYTNDMLGYDVRAYYEPDGTYSDPQWNIAYGEPFASVNENSISMQTKADEVPAEYSITNYPNPFNPTTTINYQLPENGLVTIKVYDMLGKEVATLVDGNRTAGYHNVTFDASRLTSGIYIYTITANNFVQSKKMLLMK